MMKLSNIYPSELRAETISLYVCPYTGVEGAKSAQECEDLYWALIDEANFEHLITYIDEEYARILSSQEIDEYTEKQTQEAEDRLSRALVRRYMWVACRGESCPKAVVLDVTPEYANPKHYLFCGFSPIPSRLPKE